MSANTEISRSLRKALKRTAILPLVATFFVAAATAASAANLAKTETPPPTRLSASPYIFTTAPTAMTRYVRAALKEQFGKLVEYTVTCRGVFPGTHSGTRGFHEIRCPFSASLAGVRTRGTAVYWIDGNKHVHDRIYSEG